MKNLKTYLLVTLLSIGFTSFAQDFTVDTDASSIKWVAKKVGGAHNGQINIKDGSIKVEKNAIVSGQFNIDMTSITCDDLEGEWNAKLVGHLNSDDFFGVETYPVASLKITESGSFKKGSAEVKGDLTIKGKTHPITFSAKKDGNTYTATIVIDRTLYDVKYGSGKFFDNLGDKTIDDEFTLDTKLVVK